MAELPGGPRRVVSGRDLRRVRIRRRGTAIPVSKQVRMRTVPNGAGGTVTEFLFPYAPVAGSYDSLAPEYVEIERPGRQPLVEFKKFNLLKVSLEFLVAVPFDGVVSPVDNELRILRAMANSPHPVAFVNMDSMLTNPFNILRTGTSRSRSAFFFRITDMSVNVLRRNVDNRVSSAEVSLSLIEVANPVVRTVTFPVITYPDLVPVSAATKSKANKDDDEYEPPSDRVIEEQGLPEGVPEGVPG